MNEKSAAMRNFRTEICAASLLAATSFVALAQSPSGTAVPVTVDNYNRAQSDVYFGLNIERGGFGKFRHLPEAVPVDKEGVIPPNPHPLNSSAAFDLAGGPGALMLPDSRQR